MEKGRIDFSISFLEPVGNSEQYGNVQIFVYINSNWVFLNHVAQWRRVGLSFGYHCWNQWGFLYTMAIFNYFAT